MNPIYVLESSQCIVTLEHLHMPQVARLDILPLIGGDFYGYIYSTVGSAITLENDLEGIG